MHTPSMLEEKLRELALFEPTTMPVLSVYLNTQADQHGRDNFEVFLRKELKNRGDSYPRRSPERQSFERDAEKVMSWLTSELRPSSNGAVIFACAGANDFFEALQFEAPIHKNRLYVYHQPHLYGLAKLHDQYPPYAAVIADTNSARIFVFGLGRVLDAEMVQNDKVRSRTQIHGWWLRRYQLRVENYHLKHSKDVLQQLDKIVREEGIEHIILAGDEVILPVLRQQLSPFLAAKVVDELKLDITASERIIFQATLESMQEENARSDAEHVSAMIDEYRAGGLAAVGTHDILLALANGQVDTLFVSTELEQVHPGKEDLHRALAPAVAELPVGAGVRITDALVTQAYQTGAHVRFIEDPALLVNVGGVGATLRFSL
ncbi:MAG TPA: Vms1/Ankzf1 family peptidyl-tRNA hydrolase [Bryobacteraceae bacterium]|nr:Vms1/Ankzf1 family peptidyl-tRNA hydrolase [Bryobacteraceae bacterium]